MGAFGAASSVFSNYMRDGSGRILKPKFAPQFYCPVWSLRADAARAHFLRLCDSRDCDAMLISGPTGHSECS